MNHYVNAWKNTFNFTGRARRSEYWSFALVNAVIGFALGFVAVFTSSPSAMMAADSAGGMPTGAGISPVFFIIMILQFALIVPSISVMVRRLHDTGRSGFWGLTLLIPVLNIIFAVVVLVFMLSDSKPGANGYGPNPKGVGNASATPSGASGASSVSGQFRPQAPAEPEDYQNPFAKSA
ncbi:MAG: uncharacterized membrane protein YhaH (DUF805 family) [Phycisphaerales bacterium]|jgi:uncharacterized membrane protein YhaH (DUF805 family)